MNVLTPFGSAVEQITETMPPAPPPPPPQKNKKTATNKQKQLQG